MPRTLRLRGSPKNSKLFKLLFPWIWTVIFLLSIIVTVKVFEQKNIITPMQKNTFNIISTALIVLLSLSFYVSLD